MTILFGLLILLQRYLQQFYMAWPCTDTGAVETTEHCETGFVLPDIRYLLLMGGCRKHRCDLSDSMGHGIGGMFISMASSRFYKLKYKEKEIKKFAQCFYWFCYVSLIPITLPGSNVEENAAARNLRL